MSLFGAALAAQFHDRSGVGGGNHDSRDDGRLLHTGNEVGRREIGGVVQVYLFAVGFGDFVNDGGRRGDQREAEFALQSFLHHVHMQQSQKPDAEAVTERGAGFRLEGQRRVVELEFEKGLAQFCVVARALHRIQAAENHRFGFAVSRQRLFDGPRRVGNGVADIGVAERFNARRHIADFTGFDRLPDFASEGEKVPTSLTSTSLPVAKNLIFIPGRIAPSTTRT